VKAELQENKRDGKTVFGIQTEALNVHRSRLRNEREREFIFHIAKTLNKYTTEMQH